MCFQVGDKVKFIQQVLEDESPVEIGAIGEIVEYIDEDGLYDVYFETEDEDIFELFDPEELELVE